MYQVLTNTCIHCNQEFIMKTPTQETCSNKDCRHSGSFQRKKIKHIETQRKMESDARKQAIKEFVQTNTTKQAIIKDMRNEVGFAYCNECGPYGHPIGIYLEEHHVIYRSELGNHPKKHCKANTLLLAQNCHIEYHKNKSKRSKWVIERCLWEVFPEHIRKETFI